MLKNQLKDPSLLVDRAYVDGQWISADDGATLTISDPATGETLAQVPALQGVETPSLDDLYGEARVIKSPYN
ncbi:hypothetical protein DT385_12615, partial [Pseudomonas syringae]